VDTLEAESLGMTVDVVQLVREVSALDLSPRPEDLSPQELELEA
jgi:hypothetical protein